MVMFLRHDARAGVNVWGHAKKRPLRHHSIGTNLFLRGILQYIRRDFHPAQKEIDGLAARYLAQAGLSPEAQHDAR
jgi:hypothetical protein